MARNRSKHQKQIKEEKGQALVVIIVLLVLALGVGIGISTRFIRNLRNTVTTDYSSRALAIAEAAIERLLIYPYETLEDFIAHDSCQSQCMMEIVGEDGVVATATVELSNRGGSTDPLFFELEENMSREVSLVGYPNNKGVHICWNNSPVGANPSITGLFLYGTLGSYSAATFAYNSFSTSYSGNNFGTAAAANGYQNCFFLTGRTNPQAVRLKSFYASAEVYILPEAGEELPSQGIVLEATGTVGDATKKVTVIKTKTSLPSDFDYVLYSKSDSTPLAN